MELTPRGKKILIPVVVAAFLNFAAFCIVALCLGGDAFNGRVENGVCYFSNHGANTEVGRAEYIYSYVHVIAVFVTHGAVFVTALGLLCFGEVTHSPPVK